ncbi:MAG TPA: CDP-alcohol phosphatidyltransferase family protein, partial [Natronosporangium sp.]|nr:CDP-alcohol phosphatidyltransferase family protein [Natronosporangium sp.]
MNQPVARSAPLFNAANVLTAIRLLLVPVFVIAVLVSGMTHAGWRIAAAGIFLVASLTDLVDGWIARRYGLITGFGKVADPIADKALIGAALVLLAGFGEIWWWVTGLILAREV